MASELTDLSWVVQKLAARCFLQGQLFRTHRVSSLKLKGNLQKPESNEYEANYGRRLINIHSHPRYNCLFDVLCKLDLK